MTSRMMTFAVHVVRIREYTMFSGFLLKNLKKTLIKSRSIWANVIKMDLKEI
jgi:hypothetical protein